MTYREALNNLKEHWFQILVWVFIASMMYFAYRYGTQHQNSLINAGAGACESVKMQVGLERTGDEYKIVCIQK